METHEGGSSMKTKVEAAVEDKVVEWRQIVE